MPKQQLTWLLALLGGGAWVRLFPELPANRAVARFSGAEDPRGGQCPWCPASSTWDSCHSAGTENMECVHVLTADETGRSCSPSSWGSSEMM